MSPPDDIRQAVRVAAAKKLLFLPHAVRQMMPPDRMIATSEVRTGVQQGEVIEDYPEDARGHNCLVPGWGRERRPLHVVCSPREDFLAIITAYEPDPEGWSEDFRTRLEP